ncbi:MAG TPA: hypothetical protein VJM50_21045 [Pyrinomonadaceae bacterium]|nr:hypothetical protein [Pyrinomonadaceae bacterium]
MRRRTLTELANNPDLISGIYNYCDRWCERCPLTSRCLVYATEQEDNDSPESRDIYNEAFWKKLGSIFQETREMIADWAREAGVDLTTPGPEDEARHRRKRQLVDNHPLTKAGKKYASAASDWFRELDQPIDVDSVDACEVIQWYQYQIAVKTMRALSARREELEEDFDLPKDSDGSVKVALIGIDRSIAGWRMMQLSLPGRADSIVPLILQLEMLRTRLENAFPEARDFVRPGFDENPGQDFRI